MKTAQKTILRPVGLALLLAAAVILLSGALSLQTGDALAEKVVRLHVLANSDSEADQALKLHVRDRVLERAEQLLQTASDRRQAETLLEAALPELETLAQEAIAEEGWDYGVTVELTDAAFPTRVYDDFTLPAGNYLALRVVIGAGAGRNWWCVVFPPLCAAAAADVPATAVQAGLSQEEVNLITEENRGYVLKFKSVELWESLRKTFE